MRSSVKDAERGRQWETVHLDAGGAVEAERLGLAVLQVDLQDVGHEEQRVVLDWVLRARRRKQERDDSHWTLDMIFMMI